MTRSGGPDDAEQELRECRLESEQLREALSSRAVIDQAKGILMARHAITAEEAFDLMREASQHQNRKVRLLAEALTQAATSGCLEPLVGSTLAGERVGRGGKERRGVTS